jgi:hypothetical protein
MHDIIIMVKTKRQFQEAKKRMFTVLQKLRLKISPHNLFFPRWALWWKSVLELNRYELIFLWIKYVEHLKFNAAWLARGLLLGSIYLSALSINNCQD